MEQRGIARRDFLKGVAAAALTAGFIGAADAEALASPPGWANSLGKILPKELQPFPTIYASRGTEGFWNQVRKTFVLADDYIHMNTGTSGSQPLFSLINAGVYNLYKSMDPRDWQKNLNTDFPDLFPFVNNSAMTARQTAVAAQYGANADEIVLSYNTTDAMNLIFAGTPWKEGDRLIVTQWEHNAMAGPIAWARDYFGVQVNIVDMPTNFTPHITVGDVLSLFETELRKPLGAGNKQYIAISEVFYKNGLRMPVKELSRWPSVTRPLLFLTRPTVGDSCRSIVMITGLISLPARVTSGSAAVPARGFALFGNPPERLPCRPSTAATGLPTGTCSSPPAPSITTAIGPRPVPSRAAVRPTRRHSML